MGDAADATQFLKYPLVPNEEISDTGFTVGWVLERLLETNAELREAVSGRKVAGMSTQDIGGGKGYFSSVYRIVLLFDDSDSAPFTFVIKLPSLKNAKYMLESLTDDEMRKAQTRRMREGIVRAHNGECEFYRLFPALEGLPLPKVWYTQKVDDAFSRPGLIVMQDLTGTVTVGRKGAPISSSISITRLLKVKNVARHLASFHHRQLSNTDEALKALDGVDTLTKDDFWSAFPSMTAGFVAYDAERLQPRIDGIMPLANRRFAEYALLHRHVELEAEQFIVQFYYDELIRFFKESHQAPPETLSVAKLTEAYKLAMILQALESPYVVMLFAKSDSGAGVDPGKVEADTAQLRSRLVLEDALEAAKDVAAAFIQAATASNPYNPNLLWDPNKKFSLAPRVWYH